MLFGREAMKERVPIDPDPSFCLGALDEQKVQKQYQAVKPGKDSLNIVLLASNPLLYSNKRIIEAVEELGHVIRFINISQHYINISSSNP